MDITIVGGGMITHDQILPSLFQMQREGAIGGITVTALRPNTLLALREAPMWKRAFPGQEFRSIPEASPSDHADPLLYKQVIADMAPRNIVAVAVPDQLHYDVIMTALAHNQHVLTVKPLVLKHDQAIEIDREAKSRGLVVGIEYHKRFDDRSLMARRRYQAGQFGEFLLGTACLLEKWYYRHSAFQEWFTCANTDAFTYIGCHYVDLVAFITGLRPTRVSVYGLVDRFPNGKDGYLWTDARIIWENGACLNVQNALGFPDEAPGTNTQGMTLYCRGNSNGALIQHSDQYRGLQYCYTERPADPGATQYAEPSPDYFQYVDLGGPGLMPVGYGYRSVEFIVRQCMAVEAASDRAAALRDLDEAGVMATPANSGYNELVIEAARLSVQNGGREYAIEYGDHPRVTPS